MKLYVARFVDPLLAELMAQHPAILITGPRACGKSTSARRVADAVVRLDMPREAAAFTADPDAALRAIERHPVLLDEWQEVPAILGAVKRAVDADGGPGRFLLSGSVRAPLAVASWPGTGRLVGVEMAPLAIRERVGRSGGPTALERLVADDPPAPPADSPDLLGYVELALAGGFPEPVTSLGERGRRRRYDAYVEQLVARDVVAAGYRVDPPRFAAYLRAYALMSGRVVDHATLLRAAGISRRTGERYEALAQALGIARSLPAWSTNRLRRQIHQPKRVICDGGLWAALADVGVGDVMADGDLLGGLLETFVIAQLGAELTLTAGARMHHLRTEAGRREVDVIVELGARRVLAIEIKASAAPTPGYARHRTWLRDRLGSQFVRGVVLHTGPGVYPLGERLVAVPIAALWG